ncbi:hypothetical protein RHS01_00079, partial [Rhizoctonia solani]
ATSVPISGPAPAPFRWPKPTPSKLAPKHQEPEILILSLTNNNASPQTTPAKHKPHPGMKAKPSTTYYAAKAPQPTKVKANTVKWHRNAQTLVKDLTNTLKNAAQYNNAKDAGVAKVELFGCNVSKEQLERDLATSQEQCHQLERQLDTMVVAMTMFGIQVPAADWANGPGLGLALLEFLQSCLPTVASPAAVLAAAAPTAIATAHAAVPVTICNAVPAPFLLLVFHRLRRCSRCDSGNNIEFNPALYKPQGFAASAALGSNLSVAKKGKLPVVA